MAKKLNQHFLWIVLIQGVIAFEWLKSGLGKFTKPGFMNSIEQTMTAFAAKTPHQWYSEFLKANVIPNANYFGNLVRWSEVLFGVILVTGGLALMRQNRLSFWMHKVLVIALLGGALLNLNFYFAAGWSSPSTEGINIVMSLVQLVLAAYYLVGYKPSK
jgi:hypothetical protein